MNNEHQDRFDSWFATQYPEKDFNPKILWLTFREVAEKAFNFGVHCENEYGTSID